ncbi:adenylate/guanylate cyclase domain-containing protein [Nocardioides limicola]|uniref:adenylate/guanylate cyclase domain-containing protein n=1 Tax=Nocardioides limicola TaxID=2803368 RepID=UPI00193B6CE5|nr:adenylate/guanylate cyclase domain-containing protein [Nocardioides sp. DJM-14]
MITNLFGAVLVYALAILVLPLPEVSDIVGVRVQNLVMASIIAPLGVVYGVIRVNLELHPMARWVRSGADPNRKERRQILRAPARIATHVGAAWLLSALLFGAFNATHDLTLAILVALTVGLAGWTVAAFSYLFAERAMRGFARQALESGAELPRHRSMVARGMAVWAAASGMVLLGLTLVGVTSLVAPDYTSATNLAISMIVFGGLGLIIGGLASYLAARTSADPIRAVRKAVQRIERGDYDVAVPIYDATEIGHLQAGFNRMAGGLRERDALRDLFGRHVGEEVARNALAGGVRLGGEVRHVGVLFVDIIGSTGLAQQRAPEEVVQLLNRFFDVVIDVVDSHDGWVNKFEGDAALAIWGAPTAVPDMATSVLKAARVLGRRLASEVPELSAGIGVSAGPAVAGNVGAAKRYEYTVIGDPVNEAARLTELAKKAPGLVAANGALLDLADEAEAAHWQVGDHVELRGRTGTTPIASLRD